MHELSCLELLVPSFRDCSQAAHAMSLRCDVERARVDERGGVVHRRQPAVQGQAVAGGVFQGLLLPGQGGLAEAQLLQVVREARVVVEPFSKRLAQSLLLPFGLPSTGLVAKSSSSATRL